MAAIYKLLLLTGLAAVFISNFKIALTLKYEKYNARDVIQIVRYRNKIPKQRPLFSRPDTFVTYIKEFLFIYLLTAYNKINKI